MTAPSRSDVVVVGAGLAGLATAKALTEAGIETTVVEAADAPGGRVRTDLVDGFRLDRGFQLLNPSYSEAQRVLDLEALDLRPFQAGVVVAMGGKRHTLGDPLRLPSSLPGDLTAPIASLKERLALVAWALPVGYGPSSRIKHATDRTLADELERRGLRTVTDRVLRPFLAGVLAERELSTSRRLGELFLRAFLRGTPSLPAAGMQAMPDQLAAALPAGTLHLNTRVTDVRPDRVDTAQGPISAKAVVVATDAATARTWLHLPARPTKALTTFWFRADEAPTDSAILHVDGDADGPLVNTGVVSNVAPTYASDGHLVAATVLGTDATLERAVRDQCARVYGSPTDRWELLRVDVIHAALPTFPPGTPLRSPNLVTSADGRIVVAGDHIDTPSIQGALVSGKRAARTVRSILADT
ncbi:NAD(P)/FAD-dependent oxidoreductase [Nakamurella flava]|uniref:NAD(P)/FAD-dependent oxidoreductase n=1 Tax=Nakamurella flava TaxID=2576308 RepID=UPI0014084995|nr:NAD(P)/FAD-dependent oxidoreductase [Nakamurella flava]